MLFFFLFFLLSFFFTLFFLNKRIVWSELPILAVDSNRVKAFDRHWVLLWVSGEVTRECLTTSCRPQVSHLIWKESGAPCAPCSSPIYLRPNAIEADSNISAVHATDFGSSLCKSRITPPPPRSRTFRRPAWISVYSADYV